MKWDPMDYHVYQLDPDEPSKVIAWWKDMNLFMNYVALIDGEVEIHWTFSHAYNEKYGRPWDKKNAWVTHDSRFCNRWYTGPIHRYDRDGIYVETMTVPEFKALGGVNAHIGIYGKPYGYSKYGGLNIALMTTQLGGFWSFLKRDQIKTILISPIAIDVIGEDVYHQLRRGELPRENITSVMRRKKKLLKPKYDY